MCGPLAVPLMIASTVISSAGQVMAGIGQSQQANYQAQVNDQNAKLSAQQANDSNQNTNLEAQRRYRTLAQTKGAQQAAMAANGVDLNFGSAVDVQRDTAMIGAEDVAQIYKGGAERTRGYDIQGWNYASQAAADRAKAKGALLQGIMGGLGTALGGASQVVKMGGFGGGGSSAGTGNNHWSGP
ncbi:hypothetical protein QH494_15940 [Sphingomonas sp. AR_OL41]|uniref:hypothetical protein n=1 Tax=Sphingomonas sp. AR_OL41 TaxID=3042729 RepID=UPI002480C144|nr:hypothetical protein [Sphingomonas sp. AR_OL41]MDH7973683.1 hypothetical protein [Sphingomonas sp. AR_OL41]